MVSVNKNLQHLQINIMTLSHLYFSVVLSGLSAVHKDISVDFYTNKTNRHSWYVEDEVSFEVTDKKITLNSKRGSETIWEEDIFGCKISIDDGMVIVCIIMDYGHSISIKGYV